MKNLKNMTVTLFYRDNTGSKPIFTEFIYIRRFFFIYSQINKVLTILCFFMGNWVLSNPLSKYLYMVVAAKSV